MICVDSSAPAASRMGGLNGADVLLMPIMVDQRAGRWDMGPPICDEKRWKAIMATLAMDSHVCRVIARNNGEGSCIVDRSGKFLAWNDGTQDFIYAPGPRDDGYRTWNGTCFKSVNWMQRRPHLYGEFVNPGNLGSLQDRGRKARK